jgi:hypothetical protein
MRVGECLYRHGIGLEDETWEGFVRKTRSLGEVSKRALTTFSSVRRKALWIGSGVESNTSMRGIRL